MNPSLVQKLYAATPMWYWPVLWWQLICMALRLDDLTRQAGDDIQYCVRLGPYGTLTLRFVSDNATESHDAERWRLDHKAIPSTLEPHLRRMPESQASALMRQAQGLLSTRLRPAPEMRKLVLGALYLDPG